MSQSAPWADDVRDVAVIGAGTMGEGIAQSFADAGLRVRLIDVAQGSLDRCRAQIASNLALAAKAGLAGDDPATVLDRIAFTLAEDPAEAIGSPDLVVESVPEVLETKRALFAKLDALDPAVLIGSNTSSMTIGAMTRGMASAQRVVGMHYFNPAHLIPAVELHRGEATSDEAIERARTILLRVGKSPFLVRKEIPGFVVNRLTGALMREIYHLLDEEVISPEDLDVAVRSSLGFRMAWMGPMESADHTGLDVGLKVVSAILPQLSTRTEPSAMLREKVANGDLGIKTGRGWLNYHGRSRGELLDDRNLRLLRQLKVIREAEAEA